MLGERRIERLGKRTVDAARPAAEVYRVWDSDLKGFGLKVTPRGVKTYFLWYRAGAGRNAVRREYTLGRHGAMTAEEAREEAGKALGRVRFGEDPQAVLQRARGEMNVSALCDLYLSEGVSGKKPSTVAADKARIGAHIKPLLGRRPVSVVSSADVERFMREVAAGKSAALRKPTVAALRASGLKGEALAGIERRRRTDSTARGGKGTATRTVGLLGGIFTFAVRQGLRADNPVRGVERYRDRQSQRFLSGGELARLTNAIVEAEAAGANTNGLAVIRLLALTGARKGEIEGLRWDEVDFERGCLRLKDSKTGARVVPLGAAALEALNMVPRAKASPFLFPAGVETPKGKAPKHYVGTPRVWAKVQRSADLEGVRLHDLRHTFASFGAAGGLSLPLIAAMLGHRDVKTTQQYAHLADDPVKSAADRTAAAIDGAMRGSRPTVVALRG
jgi:integrase